MDTQASTRCGGGGAAVTGGAGGSDAAISLSGDGGQVGGGGKTSVGPSEHQSPGYGAGYDAGFLAGLLAASHGRMSPPDSLPEPVAAEGGAGASAPERPPFLALLEDFPDLFQKEVLERLGRVDRALLGRTGSAARTAVKRSGLPRVGGSAEAPRVRMTRFCRGSLSMFVWAVANGCPRQRAITCETLAEGRHMEVLRWAREHGCCWDQRTCANAAEGGHLAVLQWARAHDCPWCADTCRLAAGGGHMEALVWARGHGCPWNEWTRRWGRSPGHVEMGAGAPLPVG
jgi:hypothetical protein